jgi:glycosyltransferase involved in cell wall biosynthesis
MKIAIVSDWFAPRRGGIEAQLLELTRRLGAAGNQVDVLTSTPGAAGEPGIHVRPLRVFTLPVIQLALSPALPGALRRELARGYDVVHAHVSVVSPVGYAAAAVARWLGLPTVVTFHSVLRHKRHLLRIANALAGIGRSAVLWSAVSEAVARQVRSAIRDADVCVLPNGIELAAWGGVEHAGDTARAHRDGVMLVSTMRFQRKKRPLPLIRAFARAASRANVPARLCIIGDGPERPAMEREIHDLGLMAGAARVELMGWRDHAELRAIYAGADGFVLPSTREAFGIAALEARAAGVPVIAMETSGATEFLRHDVDALICDDDQDLARSIARFLGDAALRQRLARARVSLDRYDWAGVVAEHQKVYRRAMARAGAAEGVVASA